MTPPLTAPDQGQVSGRRGRPRVGRVLLLAPSNGLGGGIERYVETLEWSFAELGVPCHRLDLGRAGVRAHAGLLAEGRAVLRSSPVPARVVLGHRALLPVGMLLAREPTVGGLSVVCHGSEAWGERRRFRRVIEGHLMRRPGIRIAAASSFTAGALAGDGRATILPPGLSREWFQVLVDAGHSMAAPAPGIRVATAFRLESWEEKGLRQLVEAMSALDRRDVRLAVYGTGQPPPDLVRLIAAHKWCTLRPGASDRELAHQLAAADLFVLATRTRPGRRACGEGFGMVLLEAQVAGTAVIAPAHGGSSGAYLEGVTGLAPVDETAEALGEVLGHVLDDPAQMASMGGRAAEWARESFAPERYVQLVARRLL